MTQNSAEETSGWPPERTVFPVSDVQVDVVAGPHPFEVAEEAEARENWQREIAANPALYDGRMVFQHTVSVRDGAIVAKGHVIPFSVFMWWRKQSDRSGGVHLFAYPVIVSSDNALVAIRMGQHTANPGQVYFAAGSLEEADIVDGRCDIESNMRREVLEETGLDLAEAVADPGYHAAQYRRSFTVFRLFRFPLTADEIVARIERHMPVAEDQEIDGAVIIRSADPQAQPYNALMLPILDWFFGGNA